MVQICRIWRGWTTFENADVYQKILTQEVIPSIEARGISGFERVEMMRRMHGDEIEFVTIMWFSSLDAIKTFVGDDYEVAHVPITAREVLSRWDERPLHYEIFDQRNQK